MNAEHKEINKQMAKGSAWMVLFKVFEKSISIVSTLILARLLIPEDFGLVAMAMIVVAFLELMKVFGFEAAIIQNQQATKDHYDTAWTFSVITSSFIAALLFATSSIVAQFYGDERLSEIMPLLALGVLISGFENIAVINFRKELRFHKDFQFLLGRKIINFTSVICMTFYFRNYWGLIAGFAFSQLSIVILSYIIHPYYPRLTLARLKDMFGFSAWIFLNNLLNVSFVKIPDIIVGKAVGAAQLGTFNMSRDIATLASSEIVITINRATFPGYSKLNNDLAAFKNSLLSTIGMIAIFTIPSAAGFSVTVHLIVPVLLGNNWLATIEPMEILAFSSLFFGLSNIFSAYLALGKPRITTAISTLRIIVAIPIVLYATSKHGIEGAAWGLLVTGIIMLPISYWPAMRILNIQTKELISIFIRPTLATIFMFLSLKQIQQWNADVHFISNPALELMSSVLLGGTAYVSSIFFIWWISGRPNGSEQLILRSCRSKIRK